MRVVVRENESTPSKRGTFHADVRTTGFVAQHLSAFHISAHKYNVAMLKNILPAL